MFSNSYDVLLFTPLIIDDREECQMRAMQTESTPTVTSTTPKSATTSLSASTSSCIYEYRNAKSIYI